MYYLDTCICIELIRGRLPLTYQKIRESSPKLFGIPSVVVGELMTGAEKSNNPAKHKLQVEQLLAPFAIVDFDASCAIVYAKIRADLEQRGQKIGPCDLMIAACAVANNATLITSNIREFIRIKNLDLENWEEIDFSQ